jgi:hypothetical protein
MATVRRTVTEPHEITVRTCDRKGCPNEYTDVTPHVWLAFRLQTKWFNAQPYLEFCSPGCLMLWATRFASACGDKSGCLSQRGPLDNGLCPSTNSYCLGRTRNILDSPHPA